MRLQEFNRLLKSESRSASIELSPIPEYRWPPQRTSSYPVNVLRNKRFLVQVFIEDVGTRLSVNRTEVARWDNGWPIWREGISWDELQDLKEQAGYGNHWMIEIYPPTNKVVNVANMRHLWLLPRPPEVGWV